MLNAAIALVASAITTFVLLNIVQVNIWIAALASVAVFAGLYILLLRHTMKKVGELMESAQKDVQANRAEKAVHTLKGGFKYGAWQFYVKPQLYSQIGSILYMKRDFAEAQEYLEKGFVRNWVGMGMLGVSYMKKNKTAKMIDTFEKGTSASKKEPLLWAVYAYCLDKSGERDKAIKVLEKAVKRGNSGDGITGNLELLKEGKKMKMQAFGDMWYQFHLEKPGAIIKKQTKAMTGRRKMVRR